MTQTASGSAPLSSDAPPLRLKELVAACVSVGWLAGEVIREVVAENVDLAMVNKAADKYDPQTVADRRSQQRMVHALRAQWPQLQIVGEEGDLAAPEPRDVVRADVQSLLEEAVFDVPAELDGELDASQLVLWMDPLDGTKKFAEKKFDEVSVLLGIAYKRRPIAGIMHLPFHGDNNGETYWGGPGIGLFRTTHRPGQLRGLHASQERPASLYPQRALRITTSGTNCPLVNEALERLKPEHVKLGGATGTMVLSVITGESDTFFRFRNATKRWDICAVEPLLHAVGGVLTDKRGREYDYDPSAHDIDFDNEHGLVVTLNNELQQQMLQTMEEIDMMRTLDGQVMTAQWLEQVIFHKRVRDWHIVPKSILKGKQSSVARIVIQFHDGTQRHVFLKRYIKEELPPRGPRNWIRDLTSYRSEARFYASVYPHLQSQNIKLIPPIDVQFRQDRNGKETGDGFIVMLENVLAGSPSAPPTLEAADCLGVTDAQQALQYLAKLHAAAIKSPDLMAQVKTYLWPSGVWWSYEKRGMDELRNAPHVWKLVFSAFRAELESRGVDTKTMTWETLGDRMVKHAAYISAQLFGEPSEAYARFKTLVHGDFKTANMFFDSKTREVTAFDWQWAGVGLGVLDVSNLLNTSVSIDTLSEEEQLLQYYYDCFQHELGENIEPSYPFITFKRHYEFATLEYARVLIANFWDDTTPLSCEQDAKKTNWGLGYRSVPHVIRLMFKLQDGLTRAEHEH